MLTKENVIQAIKQSGYQSLLDEWNSEDTDWWADYYDHQGSTYDINVYSPIDPDGVTLEYTVYEVHVDKYDRHIVDHSSPLCGGKITRGDIV